MTCLLAAYLHAINPMVLRLPEVWFLPAGIRWYGLAYVLGFVAGFLLLRRVTKAGLSTLQPEHVGDFIITLAIGVVVGGRLGYVLLYDPKLLVETYELPPFWGVLAINKGGMASHGGIIGVILASLYFARRRGHSWGHLLDLAAFATPLGLFFGRLANFVNGELYGRAVAPGSMAQRWAVQFPQEMLTWLSRTPGQSDPRLAQLAPALPHLPGHPDPTTTPITGDVVLRVIDAVQTGHQQVTEVVRAIHPPLTARHPSQLYEAALEGLALCAVLLWVWSKPRKPAVVGAWFCAAYGVARIIGEIWREPDAQIANQEFATFGVTRGQWLSGLLLLLGVVAIVLASRHIAPLMGSWRRQPKTVAAPLAAAEPGPLSAASHQRSAGKGKRRKR